MAQELTSRRVKVKLEAVEQPEGRGVRVRRSIGRPELRNFDPFLLLDEAKFSYPSAFPDHPHRGFETVSYMLPDSTGHMEHEDSRGNKGTLYPGAVQWMTAGKGVLHSEVPSGDRGIIHGIQLWVNLAAKDKMVDPAYQDLTSEDIPKAKQGGVKAAVIAGEALGVKSKVFTRTPTHYIHFEMEPNSQLHQPIPEGWNALIHTLDGEATYGDTVATGHFTLALEKEGAGLTVVTRDKPCSFLFLAGKPLNEPIAQHGPFVMNTRQEIQQAFEDFYQGKNGFESARGWQSVGGQAILRAQGRRAEDEDDDDEEDHDEL